MKKAALITFTLFTFFFSKAQDGNLDTTFNIADVSFGFGPNNSVYTTIIQDDGRILIGGDFTAYNGEVIYSVARLNIDGTLDTSFNDGGWYDNSVNTIAIQDDGKIIVGGNFTYSNGTPANRLARLHTDGTVDTTFNVGVGPSGPTASSTVNSITIQPDGKIIIGGVFANYDGVVVNRIARLNTDGSLDTTFVTGSGANSSVRSINLLSDGKIIIGGNFTTFNDVTYNRIARLNTNGSLDTNFIPGTGSNSTIRSISIQPDNKILIGGYFTTFNGVSINRVARLNANGTLDNSFTVGTGLNGFANALSIQSDNKVVVAGNFSQFNGISSRKIVRLNTNGTLDTGFSSGDGPSATGNLQTVAIQSDGNIIIGGSFNSYNNISKHNLVRIIANSLLSINEYILDNINVKISQNESSLHIQIIDDLIKSISIYNIKGQIIYNNETVNNDKLVINNLMINEKIILVKVTNKNNQISIKKILFY